MWVWFYFLFRLLFFYNYICTFSFDMRNNTKHWMTSELDEQASFYVNRTGRFTKSGVEIVQSYLQIKKVQWKDAGFYRCRVDFFQAPTRNLKVKLTLIGKASKFYSHSVNVCIFGGFQGVWPGRIHLLMAQKMQKNINI